MTDGVEQAVGNAGNGVKTVLHYADDLDNPENKAFRAAFNDCDGGRAPTVQDFTCTILEASDTIGFPVSATCTLQIQ